MKTNKYKIYFFYTSVFSVNSVAKNKISFLCGWYAKH